MYTFTRRQVSSELDYLEMYNIYTMCQVTSKQQVSQINVFLVCHFFQYRDYVVCHLKLEIESAIILQIREKYN